MSLGFGKHKKQTQNPELPPLPPEGGLETQTSFQFGRGEGEREGDGGYCPQLPPIDIFICWRGQTLPTSSSLLTKKETNVCFSSKKVLCFLLLSSFSVAAQTTF